ncbi:flagellar assembly protein FliX [Parvibaculum sp.]|uniref:flagellar assembly protein FliX n=1 Tax=Parvibaculum sp. TaxID=2024848 RepID=UPI000C90FAEE|nr:flagellar assembly protein FliX [Parvibaculum sp.]MAB14628.1 flagellar assembly protein FliX [Parvibaculum sp.]
MMKIGQTKSTSGTQGKRSAGSAASGAGSSFSIGETGQARASAGLSAPASIGAVDALLALQGAEAADDALGAPRRAMERAEDMLDILDQVKIDLLSGKMPVNRLTRLLGVVGRKRGHVADPNLQDVLDQIELRARVELAKFGNYPEN